MEEYSSRLGSEISETYRLVEANSKGEEGVEGKGEKQRGDCDREDSKSRGRRWRRLKLPNANLATVRRTNGLVLSEDNGHANASADTVVVGSDFGRAAGRSSGSAVGLHEVPSGSCCGVAGAEGGVQTGLTQHGNLSGDTVIEPEAAMIKCMNGNGIAYENGSGNGNLKMGCLKTSHLKKVGFEGLEGLEEVDGWRNVDRVEPLKVEKENSKGMRSGCGMGGELEEIQEESGNKMN